MLSQVHVVAHMRLLLDLPEYDSSVLSCLVLGESSEFGKKKSTIATIGTSFRAGSLTQAAASSYLPKE